MGIEGRNTYLLSSANVLDPVTLRQAATWKIEDHVHLAERSGFDGIELWPQGLKPLQQIKKRKISGYEGRGVRALHQSARDSAWKIRSIREAKKALFLPETVASIKYLDLLYELIGDKPVVLSTDLPYNYLEKTKFSQVGIQPQPEICKEWGVRTPSRFVDQMKNKGYTHVVLDTHHLRRNHIETNEPNPMRNWKETIPEFLPHTKEIHVGIGRDYGHVPTERLCNTEEVDRQSEARDMLYGGFMQTVLIEMLELIQSLKWKGLVTVELQPSIYDKHQLLHGQSFRDPASIYKQIRDTLGILFKESTVI